MIVPFVNFNLHIFPVFVTLVRESFPQALHSEMGACGNNQPKTLLFIRNIIYNKNDTFPPQIVIEGHSTLELNVGGIWRDVTYIEIFF